MNHKVYVTLGFHINFYHSWRGDTPDEAGFGTDIRVVREIIKMLDAANAAGLSARGCWDTEVYWTFQEILPKHSPDILTGIHRPAQPADRLPRQPLRQRHGPGLGRPARPGGHGLRDQLARRE